MDKEIRSSGVEPTEENYYKGYKITVNPGDIYQGQNMQAYATKEAFVYACTLKQLKVMIDYETRKMRFKTKKEKGVKAF